MMNGTSLKVTGQNRWEQRQNKVYHGLITAELVDESMGINYILLTTFVYVCNFSRLSF